MSTGEPEEAGAELIQQLEEPSATSAPLPESTVPGPIPEPLKLTVDEAAQRLGPKVLQVLEEKFNGSLVEVRSPDERDLFF
jgi:hypothetical protein